MTLWPSAVLDASQSCALDSQQDRIVVGIRLRADVASKREAFRSALGEKIRSVVVADAERRILADELTNTVLSLLDIP